MWIPKIRKFSLPVVEELFRQFRKNVVKQIPRQKQHENHDTTKIVVSLLAKKLTTHVDKTFEVPVRGRNINYCKIFNFVPCGGRIQNNNDIAHWFRELSCGY